MEAEVGKTLLEVAHANDIDLEGAHIMQSAARATPHSTMCVCVCVCVCAVTWRRRNNCKVRATDR